MFFLIIILAIWWFITVEKAEESRAWKNVSKGTNFLMACFVTYLFIKDRLLYVFILTSIWWFVSAGKAESSRAWKNVSIVTNLLMLCFFVYLLIESMFIYAFILMLIWWWITYFKNDEWKKTYAFTNWFMIAFLVGSLTLGLIIAIYSAPEIVLRDTHPGSYFKYLLNVSLSTGIILGIFAGLMSLKEEIKIQEKEKRK